MIVARSRKIVYAMIDMQFFAFALLSSSHHHCFLYLLSKTTNHHKTYCITIIILFLYCIFSCYQYNIKHKLIHLFLFVTSYYIINIRKRMMTIVEIVATRKLSKVKNVLKKVKKRETTQIIFMLLLNQFPAISQVH